jgi:hypothetical protein
MLVYKLDESREIRLLIEFIIFDYRKQVAERLSFRVVHEHNTIISLPGMSRTILLCT